MAVEVQVFGLVMDDETRAPVMVLRAVEGEETLPIQIGFPEAAAIAATLEKIDLPRPMTHDLMMAAIEALGGRIDRVEIVDLRDTTFLATVQGRRARRTFSLDARPSDAVALALRARVPIFVADAVFAKVEPSDLAEASRLQWMAFLQSLEASSDPVAIVNPDMTKDPKKTVH